MSNQPPYGQGPWQQQPPSGSPPGQGPAGPPSGQPGPPQYGSPPPGGYPPGGPGGPPSWPGGSPQYGGPPPGGGKSKLLPIIAIIAAVVVLAGGGVLLYFLVLSDDDDDEASGGGGGGGGGDYCTLLQDNYDYFESMSSGDIDAEQIEEAVGIIHDLRDAAPDELSDEWAQLDDPFRNLEAVLDDEGLSWTDIEATENPEDLPQSVQDAAQTFIQDLSSIDQEAVSGAINDHAEGECGIDVQESPAP